MSCGIYKIENIVNGKIYIGSSINIESRKYKHFWLLEKNKHDNHYLQQSYNKHGKDSFIHEILVICDETLLIDKENFYINKFKSNDLNLGYNLATVNEFRRNSYNDVVKKNISKTNLNKNGNFKTFSLINIKTGDEKIFETLVDGANYLINNGFANGNPRNVRMSVSNCLRGIKLSNGTGFSIRQTCYKHNFKIIN